MQIKAFTLQGKSFKDETQLPFLVIACSPEPPPTCFCWALVPGIVPRLSPARLYQHFSHPQGQVWDRDTVASESLPAPLTCDGIEEFLLAVHPLVAGLPCHPVSAFLWSHRTGPTSTCKELYAVNFPSGKNPTSTGDLRGNTLPYT